MIILFRIVTASDTFQVTLSHTAALPQCLATPQGLIHCNLMSKALSTQSHTMYSYVDVMVTYLRKQMLCSAQSELEHILSGC